MILEFDPQHGDHRSSTDERYTPARIDGWLEQLWKANGTDLHLAAGSSPLLRVDGNLVPIEGEPPLAPLDCERCIVILLGSHAERLGQGDIDFAFAWRDTARFRGNAFYERGNLSLSLRIIPMEIPSPVDIGLPAVVEHFLHAPSGLVIVTGPTGSGKSTTLACMIEFINRSRPCHILTIEDPIEHVHRNRLALVRQREIGVDAPSFSDALRAVLREDPDVLLVGEIRDLESIQTTLTVAETGHLVFATLHTNDSAQAIDRIVDVFPADRRSQIQVQLASTLQGVVYQRLLPRTDQGLVAAYEVMVANTAVRNLIREGRSRQLRNVVAMGHQEGMQTLESSLSELVAEGLVDWETAMATSLYPKEVMPAPATHRPRTSKR